MAMDIATLTVTFDAGALLEPSAGGNPGGGADAGMGGFIRALAGALGQQGAQAGAGNAGAAQNIDKPADIDAALAALAGLTPLTTQGQAALERVAVLLAGGLLEPGAAAEIDDAQMAELAEWVLGGAQGLFPPLAQTPLEQEPDLATDGFGFARMEEVMLQLARLQESLGGAEQLAEGELAAGWLRGMSGAEELDLLALDRVARAIIAGVEGELAEQGMQAGNLREALAQVSPEKLAEIMDAALRAEGAQNDLPKIPEAVLRSLAVEIVNISNDTASSADRHMALLDGLDNNRVLREEILRQIAASAAVGEEEGIAAAIEPKKISPQAQELLLEPEDGADETMGEAVISKSGSGAGDDAVQTLTAAQARKIVRAPDVGTQQAQDSITADGELMDAEDEVVLNESARRKVVPQTDTQKPGGQLEDESAFTDEETTGGEEPDNVKALRGDGRYERGELAADDIEAGDAAFAFEGAEDEAASAGAATAREAGARGGEATGGDSLSVREVGAREASAPAGEATASRYTDMSENISRLERLLKVSSGSNLKNITLQLNPQELGRITINVEYQNGKVFTTIKTENEAARDLLLSGSDQLKKNLEASGVRIETFDVSVDREGYEQNRERNQANWQAAQEEQQKQHREGRSASGRARAGGGADEPVDASPQQAQAQAAVTGGGLNVLA